MVVATGAVLYCPFHHYLPFLLLLLHNPAEIFFFQGNEPASFHSGLNKSRGQIRAAAAADHKCFPFLASIKSLSGEKSFSAEDFNHVKHTHENFGFHFQNGEKVCTKTQWEIADSWLSSCDWVVLFSEFLIYLHWIWAEVDL